MSVSLKDITLQYLFNNSIALYVIRQINRLSNYSSLSYMSAKKTVSAARREGLSVCDYVEKIWAQQGNTQKIIDQMETCGAFTFTNPNIVEIGPGTGRYLEKVFHKCTPSKYEIYETAKDWAQWLQSKYNIVTHKADGLTMQQTPSLSANLIQAHGVFVYLPFLVSYSYWMECWRITAEGGMVIFDIISEDCLNESTVENWFKSNDRYLCFLSKSFVISLFNKHGFSLVKAFMNNKYGVGKSEYLVFIKNNIA